MYEYLNAYFQVAGGVYITNSYSEYKTDRMTFQNTGNMTVLGPFKGSDKVKDIDDLSSLNDWLQLLTQHFAGKDNAETNITIQQLAEATNGEAKITREPENARYFIGIRNIPALEKKNEGEEGGDDELALQEIIDIMTEIDQEEVLEEELVVDMGHVKNGTFETNQGTLRYYEEMELAKQESTKVKEENEELNKKIEELKETVEKYKVDNKKLYSAVNELKTKMDESLLSNAKLVYSNKVLSDTSLNERQKDKIVEAIAQAKTLNEAKTLCETLKATVGTTKNNGPKSLSESVQRKSNLSSILPRNKKEINESFTFADKMKKLAGIS